MVAKTGLHILLGTNYTGAQCRVYTIVQGASVKSCTYLDTLLSMLCNIDQ